MHGQEAAAIRRCAIYTRKSTEEGLDRELNSLEAQRDTCSAYIRSQRHKGWVELPQRYDDGGWSGANLARTDRCRCDLQDRPAVALTAEFPAVARHARTL